MWSGDLSTPAAMSQRPWGEIPPFSARCQETNTADTACLPPRPQRPRNDGSPNLLFSSTPRGRSCRATQRRRKGSNGPGQKQLQGPTPEKWTPQLVDFHQGYASPWVSCQLALTRTYHARTTKVSRRSLRHDCVLVLTGLALVYLTMQLAEPKGRGGCGGGSHVGSSRLSILV